MLFIKQTYRDTKHIDKGVYSLRPYRSITHVRAALRPPPGAYIRAFSCALALYACSAAHATTTFTFTLPGNYLTSAAAYKPDGTLVRTLWRKQAFSAGAHTSSWDDKDDSGNTLPAGTYQVRVLYHNLSYTWEGVIGNTSSSFIGSNVYKGYLPFSDMSFDSANAIIARAYNEGQSCMQRFTIGGPQAPISNPHHDSFTAFPYVATDGTWYYAANIGGGFGGESTTFVTAFNVSDNLPSSFTTGTTLYLNGSYPDQTWPNCIDISQTPGTTNPNQPTGIAVQKTGSVLAVSHGYLNQVKLFDKRGGNLLGTITVTNPGRVAFAPSGDLWVVTGTSAERFASATLGSTNTPATTITGFSQPVGIAVHPSNNNIVLVTDSGASQQVKAFNSTGTSLWTYGQAGGFQTHGPGVTNDKFWFNGVAGAGYVAIQPDGSFWVGDPGNLRSLHFSSARNYIEQIAFLPGYVRAAAVDINDPTRVFGGNWLEYKVDYSKPMTPGDPSAAGGNRGWTLVNNWAAGVNTAAYDHICTVATLSNGRTYALLAANSGGFQVAELALAGARVTSINLPGGDDIGTDCALRYSSVTGGVITWYQQALTGFDVSNNPQWGSAAAIAAAPAGANDPWVHGSGGGDFSGTTRYPITSSNVLVSFNLMSNLGNHLGGVNLGSSAWLWQASPTGWLDGLGTFQSQQIDNSTNYPGNHALATGQNIVYGHHGEFYLNQATNQQGEANQFMHYWDDGMFVGEFGVPNISASNQDDYNYAVPGAAGNDFYTGLANVGGTSYLWHCDENTHGGVHRWKLDGADNIRELGASAALGGSVTLSALNPGTGLTGDYFPNMTLTDPAALTRLDGQVNFDFGAGTPAPAIPVDGFSARWTGKVQATTTGSYTFTTFSDDGVRLWVNGVQLVNDWTNHGPTYDSGTITLTAGQKYDIRMEYFENGGGAIAKLLWTPPGGSQAAIPRSQLFPAGIGLEAAYFNNATLTGPASVTRIDPTVNFSWGTGTPDPILNSDYFSARWTGQVLATATGSYIFSTISDDAVRLWVNGQQIINNWTPHGLVQDNGTITLTAGQKYDIRMEYFENAGSATAQLLWTPPGAAQSAIPQTQLFPGHIANVLANPSFEAEEATSRSIGPILANTVPTAWSVYNAPDNSGAGAFYTETHGEAHSYPYHATLSKSTAYTVNPYQVLPSLPNGTYTLSVWVRSSGGQSSAVLYCKKVPLSGTLDYSINIPAAAGWTLLTIPNIQITGGQAEIGIYTSAAANQWIYFDDVQFYR